MSRLDELIEELCPDGVDFKPLEQCCTVLDNKRKPVTKVSRQEGEYPYYGANGIQDYVAEYIFDGTFILVGEDGSVITPNGTPVVNWAEGKLWVNNHAHIIEEKSGVLLRYLYHYLQIVNVKPLIHGNIPKLTGGDFRAIQIPVPPLPVQQEIVRILDSFTELTAELTAELAARKKQYEYYQKSLIEQCNSFPKYVLGDLCDIVVGGEPPLDSIKGENPDGIHIYPIFGNGKDIYGYSTSYVVEKDAVCISSIGANTGAVYFHKGKFTPIIRLKVLIPKDERLNERFLFHAVSTIDFAPKKSSVPNMSSSDIKRVKIALPPLDKQIDIAEKLDRFDIISSSIKDGLPAEIIARQKQYEYYRDKLLTFKQAEVVQ